MLKKKKEKIIGKRNFEVTSALLEELRKTEVKKLKITGLVLNFMKTDDKNRVLTF